MPLKKVRAGIVGFGGRAGDVAHTAHLVTQGLFETVSCTEISDERYEKGCRLFECAPRRHETVEAMVKAGGIDGVMIGTPNSFHLENLLALKGSGLPVFVEKPLDSTWAKICDLARFAKEYPAPIMVGHCMRYAPIIKKADALVRGGEIGRVMSFRGVQNCHYMIPRGWRGVKEKSGTNWIEKTTHDLDVLFSLVRSKPTRLFAISKLQAFGGDMPDDLTCDRCDRRVECPDSSANIAKLWGNDFLTPGGGRCVFAREVDVWDNQSCLMHLQNGTFGEHSECYFTPRNYHHRVYELRGDKGVMEIDLGEYEGNIRLCPRYGSNKDGYTYHFDYLGRNHYNGDHQMVVHLYDVFRGAAEPVTTVEQAFIAEAAGYAAVKSSESDEYVDVLGMIPVDLRYIWDRAAWEDQATGTGSLRTPRSP